MNESAVVADVHSLRAQVTAHGGPLPHCPESKCVGATDIDNQTGLCPMRKAALDAAGMLDPNIMHLDVELPDMSGFDLLRSAAAGTRPLGIMVSNCTITRPGPLKRAHLRRALRAMSCRLERELARKERALADAAALFVLRETMGREVQNEVEFLEEQIW